MSLYRGAFQAFAYLFLQILRGCGTLITAQMLTHTVITFHLVYCFDSAYL